MPKLDLTNCVEIKELKVVVSDLVSKKSGEIFKKLSIVNERGRELKILFADDLMLAYLEEKGYDVDNLVTEDNGKN